MTLDTLTEVKMESGKPTGERKKQRCSWALSHFINWSKGQAAALVFSSGEVNMTHFNGATDVRS